VDCGICCLSTMSADLAPFETVAGSTPFLLAQNHPGKVFKPVHPCEKDFYENIQKHPQLLKLVAKYFGTLTLSPSSSCIDNANIEGSEYLVLEDLTHGYIQPCILDVKLGTTHHDLDSSRPSPPRSKYYTTPYLGFCLTGMQVYNVHLATYEYMDKSEGRILDENTVVTKLTHFFHNGKGIRENVIRKLLRKLQQVHLYFENQPAYTFRSTSLLLIYEGMVGTETGDGVDVRLIDFAHAKPNTSTSQVPDEYGYLFGTRNLMKILESIHSKSSAAKNSAPEPEPVAPPSQQS